MSHLSGQGQAGGRRTQPTQTAIKPGCIFQPPRGRGGGLRILARISPSVGTVSKYREAGRCLSEKQCVVHLSHLIAVKLHCANAKSAATTRCIVPRSLTSIHEAFHDAEQIMSCYIVYKTASIPSVTSAANIVSPPWVGSADDLDEENASRALIKASSCSSAPTCLRATQP